MKSRIWAVAAIIAAMILSLAGVAVGQDRVGAAEWNQIIEQLGSKGVVNWTAGYVEAVGIGAPAQRFIGTPQARPTALLAAKRVAERNILEVVKGVRVSSTTTIRDFTVESDIIKTEIEGYVKGVIVMKEEYMSDGTVEVTVRMPLSGNIASVVIPKILEKRQVMPAPQVTPQSSSPAPSEVFTGLVVDARGIQARPAMSPRIVDEKGQEVYGSMNVDREYAVQQGMSGYARDLTAAQSNPRVTNSPFSVKGLRTEGAGRSDIVIANAEAEKIRAAGGQEGFLKKCRVMIVLD